MVELGDFAHEIKEIVDFDHPDAATVVLACDNLNTHTPASMHKAFTPSEARRILEQWEIHYTPKHGSWLDVAEIELSAFSRQCLMGRRIDGIDIVRREARGWAEARNASNSRLRFFHNQNKMLQVSEK